MKPKSILIGLIFSVLAADAAFSQVIPGSDFALVYDLSGVAVYFKPTSVHEQSGVLVATIRAFEKGQNTLSNAPDKFAATDCKQLGLSATPFGTAPPSLEPVTDPKMQLIVRAICAQSGIRR
ncbi:hypothetical protein [Bradyrhizobium sp. S69]|uniref:hypothetical protein n=1 Tax=Bradyrhizobium sp. S69 TaxID=1641856 RepID=UPI00131D910F|nr:hypothetical protein [Bradyrhizobium sp. S69]